MRNSLLHTCVTVIALLPTIIHCFSEVVVRRKYKSSLMDEPICKMFVRRVYNDGSTYCFDFPYNCGIITTFPEVIFPIRKESCATVSLFKEHIRTEFQRIKKSIKKSTHKKGPKGNLRKA